MLSRDDYAAVAKLLASDGVDHWFEERDGHLLLVEKVDDYLTVEWLYLPSHHWYRVMFRDRRRVPVHSAAALAGPSLSAVMRVGISRRGMGEGWTQVSGCTPHDTEGTHHGAQSVRQLREAFIAEAKKVSEEIIAVLEDAPTGLC